MLLHPLAFFLCTFFIVSPFFFVSCTELRDLWSRSISSSSAASFTTPYISPSLDTLVVGSKTESIVAGLSTTDGSLLWSSATTGRVSKPPTIFCTNDNDNRTCVVLAGSSSLNALYVLNATAGTTISSQVTTRVIDTSPGAVLDEEYGKQGLLTCFGSSQEFKLWGNNLTLQGSNVGSFPGIWTKSINQRPTSACVPVNGNSFAIGAITGDFFLLNAKTGAEIWKQNVGTQVNARPLVFSDPVHGQVLILATADGRVIVLKVSGGALVYSVRVSGASNGLQACGVHPDARMVITGDDDGGVQGLSLVDGRQVFDRILASETVVSIIGLTFSSPQREAARARLQLPSAANVSVIAGAANKVLFLLHVTDSEVKVVFSHSSSTSMLTGGISASPSLTQCIFGTQQSQVRCISASNVIDQLDPTIFNTVGASGGGLSSAAQIAIVVSCAVVGAGLIGVVVILVVLPRVREARDNHQNTVATATNQQQQQQQIDNTVIRETRIRRHELEIQEQETRRRQAQQQQQQQRQGEDATIFETFPQFVTAKAAVNAGSNNNDQRRNSNDDDYDINQEELARIAAIGNDDDGDDVGGGGKGIGKGEVQSQLRYQQASGSFVVAARLQLPIFANRLEMLATKTEQTPAPQLDFATLSFLCDNFSTPIVHRDILELHKVICPALSVDVLEVYLGAFVFSGRHCDLLICKTMMDRKHRHDNNNTNNNNNNNKHGAHHQNHHNVDSDDDNGNDDDADDGNQQRNDFHRSLRIPPALRCVLGYVPAVRDVSWIVVDTELLLNASQISSSVNPLDSVGGASFSSSSSSTTTSTMKRKEYLPLSKILDQQQVGTKTYTCAVCYDTVEVHRVPRQTSLVTGSLCSASSTCSASSASNQQQHQHRDPRSAGPHFTCGTCLSGSVEKLLDQGDTSIQFVPCYSPECAERRNRFDPPPPRHFTPAQQQQQPTPLVDRDESGYFIFDDFSGVLKPATLRRWQRVSTEAGRALGQKEVMSALPSSSSSSESKSKSSSSPKRSDEDSVRVRDHCARIRGLLRPRCPHCGLEFMSFVGCVSVTCGVRGGTNGTERIAGCGKTFCGACMESFPCTGGHQHDFMNPNQIQQAWQRWRNRRVNTYLADHFSDWRSNDHTRAVLERVLRTSISDLMETGIWPLQKPWGDVIPH